MVYFDKNDSSLLDVLPLPEQGAAASMVATIMPVTVFAKRAMEDRTAKLLLEKVGFFHVVPPSTMHEDVCVCACVCVCMCVCVYRVCVCVCVCVLCANYVCTVCHCAVPD